MFTETADVRGDVQNNARSQSVDRSDRDDPKRLGGLVLARQLGESIMIGESIEVEVVGLKTQTVRLRIVAPRSVGVYRREVFDSIRLAPRSAGNAVARELRSLDQVTSGPDLTPGALVLTRRAGQTIMIGDEVAIDVVEARPGTVRLRVIAPRSIQVHRREVFDAIQSSQLNDEQADLGLTR